MVVAAGGGFGGKPRPALVIQTDHYSGLSTVVLALFTTVLTDAHLRPRFEPSDNNGLRQTSDLMVDILVTARVDQIGQKAGALAAEEMTRVDRALITFLGLAGGSLDHRLFFAVRPPPDLAEYIAGAGANLLIEGRRVASERLHITIGIFDDEPAYPQEMADLAEQAAASIDARPFRVVFDRIVGSSRSALLVPSEPLRSIRAFQKRLADALTRLGLVLRQGWRFNPHITLAYGDYDGMDEAIDPISWTVDEFMLIHSLLGQTRHVTVGRWALNNVR